MFCPRCSQAAASSSVRFCANCGLRLDGVNQLLANDGLLPGQLNAEPPALSPRKKGMRMGAKFLFASLISFPLFFALCFIPENPVPLLVPATLFLTGISWMLYARFFFDDHPVPNKSLTIHQQTSQVYLSPAQAPAMTSFSPPPIKTAEIEPPHSVIEHTTRHLVKD